MVYLRTRKGKVRSEKASPGYIPQQRTDDDDDSVVRAVLGRLERRWARAIQKKTMCSVDDLAELPSYTVEITTDNMEKAGPQSPRFFHSDSLRSDILEEYYVHRFKPSSVKPKKKPVARNVTAEDESVYTLDFQDAGVMGMNNKSVSHPRQKVTHGVEEEFEEILDRNIYSYYVCNCCHDSNEDEDDSLYTNTLSVKEYLAQTTRNRIAAHERILLDSRKGLDLKDFLAWKKKKDSREQVMRQKRVERIAAFRPRFDEELSPQVEKASEPIPRRASVPEAQSPQQKSEEEKIEEEEMIVEENVQEAEIQEQKVENDDFQEEKVSEDEVQEDKVPDCDETTNQKDEAATLGDDLTAYEDDSWGTMSTYSTLSADMQADIAVSDAMLDVFLAQDLLRGFAESRGVPFESLTDSLVDDLFCQATLPDSISESKTQGRDDILKEKYW